MGKYSTKDIIKLDDISAIQKNTSMYIGSTENPNHLVIEAIDNVLDEVQAGFCKKMVVSIDTETKEFSVVDYGRGFPFDEKLPKEKDPPIMACMEMSTSGKFNKSEKDSPYKIASGLHGIGLTAVNALSEKMTIEIYKSKKHAKYNFENGKFKNRRISKLTSSKKPFSTKISAIPNKKYFSSLNYDINSIRDRLSIAKINYEDFDIEFIVNGKSEKIQTSIDDILNQLSKDTDWFFVEHTDKKYIERYKIWFTWNISESLQQKIKSSVNLVPVDSGVHINKVLNSIKSIFQKQKNYKFDKADALIGFRMYMDLRLVNTAFDAQVKVRLENKSDISILDNIDIKLNNWKNKNKEKFEELCKAFENIRKQRNSSSLKTSTKKRGSTKFTKLKDCTMPGGELLVGEGDSAISGLNSIRDIKKHAVLPLRGVVPNAITMDHKKILKNDVMSDLIMAIGTGIDPNVNINNIRYNKILLAADADPAGKFITTLLIIFFAKYIPDIIKNGYLYVCETPLYGTGKDDTFSPIWKKEQFKEAKKNKVKIRRFKGLGEFNPKEIFRFTFGKERKLIQVKWTKDMELLEKIMSSPEYKRKLLNGEFDF